MSWQANVRLQSRTSVTQVFEKLQSMYENSLTLLFDTHIATSMYHLFLGDMDDEILHLLFALYQIWFMIGCYLSYES